MTFKIQITGRVQGVGFRPYVFNLAKKNNLFGRVSNNAEGVLIYINTSKEKAKRILSQIIKEKPEVSIISSYTIEEVEYQEYKDFVILASNNNTEINIPLTPDFAVCQSCKSEIKDLKNKRFNYAFTTCVHCGPRYAVTSKFPFERANTTVSDFKMCEQCEQEYINPNDKRFHSQTNSCSKCGISLQLVTNNGIKVEVADKEIITQLAKFISEGEIVAIKNTNGYLLCCDATNKAAIQNLRTRKQRPNKPFAVLYPSIEAIKKDFVLSHFEEKTLQSSLAPIVILQNTENTKIETRFIAPNLNYSGVMLPSSSLLELILDQLKKPIIATSGNTKGSPINSKENEAQKALKNIAEYFLHHNLKIEFPQDDSLVKFVENTQIILRRSRGLAPNYLAIKTKNTSPILAMGGHLKSTFTFVPKQHIYVSQYFGNLDNYEVLTRYQQTIYQYADLFDSIPKTILIDKHPQYQSSILGKELAFKYTAEIKEIQHHKAHFASVLGEHDLFASTEKILGVVWDGTGFGEDNMIWGGEFFMYQNQEINRLNHFEYFDWLANDKMAKEPKLSLFSLLNDENRHLIKNKFSTIEWKIYSKILKNNTSKTSSVGRLFDAVASALAIVDINTFEAEAAMLLENCASNYSQNNYIDFLDNKAYDKIPSKLIIQSILTAYKAGLCKKRLAYSFIYTLAKIIINSAKKNKVKIIACSGGVFQNSLLILILSRLAKKENIDIKLNRKLSPNDENISFGQFMYQQNIKN